MAYRPRRRTTRILTISDEAQLLTLLRRTLTGDGSEVVTASLASLDRAVAVAPDAVIVDMPAYSAQALSSLRKAFPTAAMLVLLSDLRPFDGIEVLDLGAEFLTRPFLESDLVLKLRAARRIAGAKSGEAGRNAIGALSLDAADGTPLLRGQTVALSPAGTAILARLVRSDGWVGFPALLETLLHPDAPLDRQYVRSVIWEIRRRVAPEGFRIENERSIGYRLVVAEAVTPSLESERSS
jgi:DNA-binding response OmpR family regulator